MHFKQELRSVNPLILFFGTVKDDLRENRYTLGDWGVFRKLLIHLGTSFNQIPFHYLFSFGS